MKVINYIKAHIYQFVIPFGAVLSFLTWYLQLSIVDNIYIFGIVLIVLTFLKQPPSVMMVVVLFSFLGTYTNELYLLYQIMFLYVVIVWLINYIKTDKPLKGRLVVPLFISSGLSLLTLFWTPSILDGIAEFLVIIQGVVAYIIFINDDHENKLSFKQLPHLLTFLVLVLGLQYFILTYEFFPNTASKQPLFEFWINPNLVAAMLGLIWIPSLYKYKNIKKNKWLLLAIPIELLAIYSIYMSMSRGLYVAYGVGALFVILLLLKVPEKYLLRFTIALVFAFALGMVIVIYLKDDYPHIHEFFNDQSSNRIEIYEIALRSLKNPFKVIFGNGLGAARYNLTLNGKSNIYYHSWFFHILGTRGIINLIMQLYIITRIFKIAINSKMQAKFILIGFIIYLTHSLVDIGYDYQHLGILYYMMVALVEFKNNQILIDNNKLLKGEK